MVDHERVCRLILASATLVALACGSSRPAYSPENAPPTLEWVTPPPQYSVTANLTLSLRATSPLGVQTVYAMVGSTRTPATKQEDGTWSADITLPVVGHNILAVWAEDFTSPNPNSGENGDPPYRLVADVNYAPTPPSLSYDAGFGSYTDERSIQLVTDSNGIAKMPAEYTIGPKLPIPPGGDIYKASTRLSGGTMTAAELESTNKNNIPVLRFTVPHNPNIDPPLETPTYVAHVTCSGCPEYKDASGSLLAAAATDPQRALFDLPVSTETVPALAQVQGAATLSFTITVRSSSGVETTIPGFNFIFHALGPPLAITEDSQYAAAATLDSTYGYPLAANAYAKLWNAAALPSPAVRLARYIITNPTDQAVALKLSYSQAAGGSWQAYETWVPYNVGDGVLRGQSSTARTQCSDGVTYQLDGFTYRQPMCVSAGAKVSCWDGTTGTTGSATLVYHVIGDKLHQFNCSSTYRSADISGLEQAAVFSSADVSTVLFRAAAELGGQERAPDLDPSGQWVLVPPAAGSIPGALVVYLTRPASATRTRALQWNLNGYPGADSADHYQTWEYTLWTRSATQENGNDWYYAFRVGWYLATAEDRLYGSILGSTQALTEGVLLGEPASRLNLNVSKQPLFAH